MQPPRLSKSKSKQIIKYIYRYAIEKYTTQNIESMIPYGEIGMILWEVGHQIYEVMQSATDEDRNQILSFVQQASNQHIQEEAEAVIEDIGMINTSDLAKDAQEQVVLGIYQTLRAMPNHRISPNQLAQQINQSLFQGNQVIVPRQINPYQSIGASVVHSILNGGAHDPMPVQSIQNIPKIERFEILGLLGQGSYARVFLAKDLQLPNTQDSQQDQTCALKVGVLENRMRLNREIEFMKSINHNNVLTCLDADVYQDEQGLMMYWIAMPNMGGTTLADLITYARLDLKAKLLIFSQLVEGLSALHDKGIIHRDLKPSNCLISHNFQLKITDFGLSKHVNLQASNQESNLHDVIGTPAYMSPEQINGDSRQISFATDIWAFGMIAYEIIVSDLPWGRNLNTFQLTGNILHLDIDCQKLSSLGLPALESVIKKCLQRNQCQRFSSATELKDVLIPIIEQAHHDHDQAHHDHEQAHHDHAQAHHDQALIKQKNAYQKVWGSSLFLIFGAWLMRWVGEADEQAQMQKRQDAKSLLKWVKIQGGSFQMGSNDPKGDDDEKPIHTVDIQDFEISQTEVTVKQYRMCVDAKICTVSKSKLDDDTCNWGHSDRDDFPMNCVNWYQARTFAHWVGGELPSEAQWEYVARSTGQTEPYPWGSALASCEMAVMFEGQDGCGLMRSWPVCSKPKGNTKQGLCDMAGNVWEWVLDERHGHYEGAPKDGSAWCKRDDCADSASSLDAEFSHLDLASTDDLIKYQLQTKSHLRVHRGGGWKKFPDMRVSNRPFYPPQPVDYPFIGIRVVNK